MKQNPSKLIGLLDLISDDYYRLSEHFALVRHFYKESITREEYVQYMEEHIRLGHIGIFVGKLDAPIETTLEDLGDLNSYIEETTLQDDSPIVCITSMGASFLAHLRR